MVHALVMSFGWLECAVVVFGTQVGLMGRVGALEERKISQEHFAIWGLISSLLVTAPSLAKDSWGVSSSSIRHVRSLALYSLHSTESGLHMISWSCLNEVRIASAN